MTISWKYKREDENQQTKYEGLDWGSREREKGDMEGDCERRRNGLYKQLWDERDSDVYMYYVDKRQTY